jgi:hypothetical protein
MKNLLFFLIFAPVVAFGNTGNPGLEVISNALNTGDIATLSKYFADNVEISILDKEQIYPKAKATEVIRAFFDTNKPKSFSQVHKGTSRGNSDEYCIGNMTANSGNYRIYLYLKVTGNSVNIKEMRINKE